MIFRLDFLTPGMNGSDGLIRENFHTARKMKDRLTLLLLEQKPLGMKPINYPVRVTYIRYTERLMDWDNACASFKHIGDALQEARILANDNPVVIEEFIPRQIKGKRKDRRTEIIIERITP